MRPAGKHHPIRETPAPLADQRGNLMAVSDLVSKANAVPAGVCAACHALATLPPDKAATLLELLSSEAIKYSELADEISADPDWPITIDRQPLARHARGTCSAKTKLRGGTQ